MKIRNITLNTVCILLAFGGISWTVNYFWKYVNYEITNDAVVDQYIIPVNIRVAGYIREVRFTEHQQVKVGDTLLILDDREYRIKLKDAEAALLDAHASKDILSSGIETSQVNIGIQEANIAETKARLWQLEQDYQRYANLLAEESVSQQQYEQVKANYEAMKARYDALLRQKNAAQSQYTETSKKSGSVEATILRKEADLEMAQLNLSYTVVTAPFTGNRATGAGRANPQLSRPRQRQMDHCQLQRDTNQPHLHRAAGPYQGGCHRQPYLPRHGNGYLRGDRI